VNGFTGRRPQQGAGLLLALLLLTLLGGLVTHALQANQWQRRIASHEIAGARAEAAARSALEWAEQWLMHLPGDAPPACTPGCDPSLDPLGVAPVALAGFAPLLDLDERWWLDHAHADGFDPVSGSLLADRSSDQTPTGRWTVIPLAHPEAPTALDSGREIRYYRVLARAVPARRGEPVLVETVVARPWGDPRWQDTLPAGGSAFCAAPDAPRPCGRLRWQQWP
jgi:Tfp pilus assembly protein PilX